MTNTASKSAVILSVAGAHRALLAAASTLFRTCENIVKTDDTVTDFDATAAQLRGDLEQLGDTLNTRLVNEWSAFENSLRVAVSNARHDVPRRQGFDEKNHARTFSLNAAGSAFTRLRNAAREHLITQIEA
jgi:hypothetical protein